MLRSAGVFVVVYLIMTASVGAWDYTVTSTVDLPDTNLGDRICQAANGECTLRAAVEEVNQDGAFYIFFAESGMTITLDSQLWLMDDVIIKGFADGSTIIQTSGLLMAFYVAGVDLTLQDLTVRYAVPAVEVDFDGSVTVDNCDFVDNGSPAWEGAIYASPGSVTLIDSSFRNNTTAWDGGAVRVYSPVSGTGLTVRGCSFTTNWAGGDGGAIKFDGGDVFTIEDSVFDGNTAIGSGGAVAIDAQIGSADGEIRGSELTNNAGATGGAISVTELNGSADGSLLIETTNIGFNDATAGGGGLYLAVAGSDRISLRDSSVYVNESEADGGGLMSAGAEILNVVNSTFSLNTAVNHGGGLYLSSSRTGAALYSSTITQNVADSQAAVNSGEGGGIYFEDGSGLVYARNTILARNSDLSTGAYSSYAPDCSASVVSEGYNLVGFANFLCDLGSGGTGDLVGSGASGAIDPLVGTLMMNSGWPTFVHPLLGGSPAINAADPAGCFDVDGTLLLTDQVGRPRYHDGRCDIGAYETGPPVQVFSDDFETGDARYWEVTGGP